MPLATVDEQNHLSHLTVRPVYCTEGSELSALALNTDAREATTELTES